MASYRFIAFVILVLLAAVFGIWRGLATAVTGYQPFGEVTTGEIDQPSAFDDRDAPRFLAARNRVSVEVPRDMTLLEFLRLYQIDFPHVRRQIAEQQGVDSLDDGDTLAAGSRFDLTLTPPAERPP